MNGLVLMNSVYQMSSLFFHTKQVVLLSLVSFETVFYCNFCFNLFKNSGSQHVGLDPLGSIKQPFHRGDIRQLENTDIYIMNITVAKLATK